MYFPLFADVAGGDQAQDFGLGVQPGHGQVHGDPDAAALVAQQEAFLGVEEAGLLVSVAQPVQPALHFGTE